MDSVEMLDLTFDVMPCIFDLALFHCWLLFVNYVFSLVDVIEYLDCPLKFFSLCCCILCVMTVDVFFDFLAPCLSAAAHHRL